MAVGWDIRRFDELDSTNRWVLDAAREGAPEGLVAVAAFQTAGRGRLGRTWVAPPGASLLMSVLLRPVLPQERLHLVTAAVALSAADGCAAVAGFRPELKWPNDLLADGRKLAGVLAEVDPASGSASGLPAVVVGIGVNLNWPREQVPAELAETMTAANLVTGQSVDVEAFLTRLLDALGERVGRWDAVAEEYRQACATVGQRVRVDLQDGSVTGTAEEVTADGHLVVVGGDGVRRTITAGDIVHLRSVSPDP